MGKSAADLYFSKLYQTQGALKFSSAQRLLSATCKRDTLYGLGVRNSRHGFRAGLAGAIESRPVVGCRPLSLLLVLPRGS